MSKLRQLTGRKAYLWSPLAYSILKTVTAGSKAFNRGLQSSHGDVLPPGNKDHQLGCENA